MNTSDVQKAVELAAEAIGESLNKAQDMGIDATLAVSMHATTALANLLEMEGPEYTTAIVRGMQAQILLTQQEQDNAEG